MDFVKKLVEDFRVKRTEWLLPLGKFFIRFKIKAVYVTFLAFVLGVTAVYFLFINHLYFVIFGILHLVFDGLDGVVARATKVSRLGAHLDNISDRLIIILILIKSYFYFNDYFILVVLGIHFLHHLIFELSDLKGKVSYSRSLALILYFLGLYTWGYFAVGVISLYGLSQQFNDFLKKKFTT